MSSSSRRASSPLATPGPRKWLAVSPQSAVNANLVAARFQLTQRILVDAMLEDVRALELAARRVARQRGDNAVAGSGRAPAPLNGQKRRSRMPQEAS